MGPIRKIRATALYRRRLAPVLHIAGRWGGRLGRDDVALVSGGVAFYAFLSTFPATACALMIWGLFTSSAELRDYFEVMQTFLPGDAYNLITDQMIRIAKSQHAGLSWGALFSLIVALWSASRGSNALLQAVAITYDHPVKRGFIKQNLLAIGFTAGAIIFAVISLAIIGAVPPILKALQLGTVLDVLLRTLRWIVLLGLFLAGIYTFLRTARPNGVKQQEVRSRRILPGAIAAAIIWLSASLAFSFYLGAFANYNETFGSLGAVAALLMWLWLSAFAICAGSELNGVLSRNERHLTTETAEHAAKLP